ncbi:MAG: hypothetical protein HPY87_09190 [Fervidobacterium sp.]|uniref:hypothetical protein n=1 Tax=Fervidobacterium sp. TaxID=1871331 RepID=UPI0025BA9638|nr:hypothetical protein [Fervidobacterium sp.]NPU90033.1 hypothetical protein [Fervidobacterium sp.]
MAIEREKKYFVDETLAKNLIKSSLVKLGVIQWYLEKCPIKTDRECRVRYTVDEHGNEKWIVAFKSELRKDFTRIEEEHEINPSNELFEELSKSPVVVKIRYFLSFKPAEVVLDEFLEIDEPYRVNIKYMAEIETEEEFEKYESMFNLRKDMSIEEFKTFTNKNIAVISQIKPEKLIEKVRKIMNLE